MSLSREDQQIQRYVDGQLSESDAAAFAARMLSDGGLRQRVEALEQVQAGFASVLDANDAKLAPAGFTAAVMSEVRRLPGRDQLQHMDVAEGTLRWCKRLLLAAALLCGLGLAWHSGLLSSTGSSKVEAAPGDVEREMDRLDKLAMDALKSGSSEAPRRGR